MMISGPSSQARSWNVLVMGWLTNAVSSFTARVLIRCVVSTPDSFTKPCAVHTAAAFSARFDDQRYHCGAISTPFPQCGALVDMVACALRPQAIQLCVVCLPRKGLVGYHRGRVSLEDDGCRQEKRSSRPERVTVPRNTGMGWKWRLDTRDLQKPSDHRYPSHVQKCNF